MGACEAAKTYLTAASSSPSIHKIAADGGSKFISPGVHAHRGLEAKTVNTASRAGGVKANGPSQFRVTVSQYQETADGGPQRSDQRRTYILPRRTTQWDK